MPGILTFLKGEDSYVEVGIVQADLGRGLYRVKIGGRLVNIKTAVGGTLRPGQSVIVNRAGQTRYIVGSVKGLKNQQKKEIVVSG